MFFGAFFCGMMPACCQASQRVMNLISVFGAGLLTGAALIVVIPESIGVILEATYDPEKQDSEVIDEDVAFSIGGSIISGFSIMLIIDEVFKIIKDRYE